MLLNQVHQGDCLDLMPLITDASVDMILCDLPYGITACDWDTPLDFDRLWEQYKRIVKSNAAIVLTGSQPFTSKLVMSNLKWFKYEWIWHKPRPTGFLDANNKPMRTHESILIFCNATTKYNPQMVKGKLHMRGGTGNRLTDNYGHFNRMEKQESDEYYPRSIVKFNTEIGLHPTQKPVKLFEYLIRTYTDEGDLVLDNCIGSGTSAIAALNTGRNFIGIELSPEYCKIARTRIERETRQERLKL